MAGPGKAQPPHTLKTTYQWLWYTDAQVVPQGTGKIDSAMIHNTIAVSRISERFTILKLTIWNSENICFQKAEEPSIQSINVTRLHTSNMLTLLKLSQI